MDLFDDEPSERTIRAINRNAVREAFERDAALAATTTATTTTTTTTSMEKAASKSTDDDRVAVSRRVDDKYTTDDKRQPSLSRPNLPRCDCINCRIIITIMHRVGGPKET